MDNLRASIELLFLRGNVEEILGELDCMPKPKQKQNTYGFNKERFVQAHHNDFPLRYNDDQVENLWNIVDGTWTKSPISESQNKSNPLNILLQFTNKVLCEYDDEPICDFKQLLRWRDITLKLGEDIFTTAYLAHKDIIAARPRAHFAWPVTVGHNNASLNNLIKRESPAELHAHLNGSTHIFELNWLSLMNHIEGQRANFEKIKFSLLPDVVFDPHEKISTLNTLVAKAAAIRAYLFEKVVIDTICTDYEECYLEILREPDEQGVMFRITALQNRLNILRYEHGRKYGREIIDYAIPANLPHREANNHLAITAHHGERRFMYTVFRYIFAGSERCQTISSLFYAYLIAKARLRKELVQINNRLGFKNFQTYQDRKVFFIREGSIYEQLIANLAINGSLAPNYIQYIETRLAPKNKRKDLERCIHYLDANVLDHRFVTTPRDPFVRDTQQHFKHHYILHFIKSPRHEKSDLPKIRHLSQCRNYFLRKEVKQQAFAINELRKTASTTKHRIVGIDAASSEIGYRPEIFATAYRYLKNYSHYAQYQYLLNDSFPRLGITYHVGEDFMDIVDGLRAVDEALLFLNMGEGDRIGHGLVLGVDAHEYYKRRNNRVLMSAQDFLDNVSWMLHMVPRTNMPNSNVLMAELSEWFDKYFRNIYGASCTCNHQIYHRAWKLRGDDPVHYKHFDQEKPISFEPFMSFWNKSGLNDLPNEDFDRQTAEVYKLYHTYHYNHDVRANGAKRTEEEVSCDYVRAVHEIQKYMQRQVASKHILIETNPSSNYVIGEHRYYDKHPMLAFYDNGLSAHMQQHDCCQIPISIGTDDQGVFATSLENEYSIMALSLEKWKNANGQTNTHQDILCWLQHISRMSNEYKFKK